MLTKTELENGYVLRYRVGGASGSATIAGGDGYFALSIVHTADAVTVKTDEGEETRPLSGGAWEVEVISGVANVYHNGRFALSFRMTRGEAVGIETAENGLRLAGLEASPCIQCASFFDRRDAASFARTEIPIGLRYALELCGLSDGAERICVSDGIYRLELRSDGKSLRTVSTTRNNVESEEHEHVLTLLSDADKRAYFRIVVTNGLGQLFLDNRWRASFRLGCVSEFKGERGLHWISRETDGGGDGFLAVRAIEDRFHFSDDFSDPSTEKYWNAENARRSVAGGAMRIEADGAGRVLLHGFAKDPTVETTVTAEARRGKLYLASRWNADLAWLKAGYSFDEGRWEIRACYREETLVAQAPGDFPSGEAKLKLLLGSELCALQCNGETVVSTTNAQQISHGRFGFALENTSAAVSSFDYVGDGNVYPSIAATTIVDGGASFECLELRDGSVLLSAGGGAHRSTDRGRTWTMTELPEEKSGNMIRLQTGEILCIKRRRDPDNEREAYIDYAYLSYDDCKTFEGPYRIQKTSLNRISMQNKVIQARGGRILYASYEQGHGEEVGGAWKVYFSDDGGHTWDESNEVNVVNSDFWDQEPKVAEMVDGTMRCYARNERGFLGYVESTDQGATWGYEHTYSEFISPMCAFNIEPDPFVENQYFMTWEYSNVNDEKTKYQLPRQRVALAVSRDGCKTWQYVCDATEFDVWQRSFLHMNLAVRPLEDCVIVNFTESIPRDTHLEPGSAYVAAKVVRIDKADMIPQARFSQVHMANEPLLGFGGRVGTATFAYSSKSHKALARGLVVGLDEAAKDGTLIPADLFAHAIGAICVRDGATWAIKNMSNALSAGFVPGQATYWECGRKVPSSGVTEQAGDRGFIPAEDAARAFGKTVYLVGDVTVVSSASDLAPELLQAIADRLE